METNQEVLEKIKDFIQKIVNVNNLYDQFLKSKEENDEERAAKDWEKFTLEWKNLTDEKNDFFIMSISDVFSYPSKKAIISSIILDAGILKTQIHKDWKEEPTRRQLTKASIHYSIDNNEDDSSKESCFPYFGMYFILTLKDNTSGMDNSESVAIAKTKRGCNLISPNFDLENITISNPSAEVQFDKAKDFADVTRFCEEIFSLINDNLINEGLGSEKLIRTIKLCQG